MTSIPKDFKYTRTPVGDYENSLDFFAEVLSPHPWNPGDPIDLDGASLAEEVLPSVKAIPSVSLTLPVSVMKTVSTTRLPSV